MLIDGTEAEVHGSARLLCPRYRIIHDLGIVLVINRRPRYVVRVRVVLVFDLRVVVDTALEARLHTVVHSDEVRIVIARGELLALVFQKITVFIRGRRPIGRSVKEKLTVGAYRLIALG